MLVVERAQPDKEESMVLQQFTTVESRNSDTIGPGQKCHYYGNVTISGTVYVVH